MTQRRSLRTGTERHAARFSTSASRSNSHYSLQETHATPDGHPVKQTGKHTWLINDAGIVIHRGARNPITGNTCYSLTRGDEQFGQDFTLHEALRTADRLISGRSFQHPEHRR
ncbi:TPA: DUF4761 family protein [Escherichia coli]|uniref:DUF4761 family protein n=2 Tax=Escherichia coli TaxID=562 RepID=UPI00169D7180|nr:DUF4761 family protein [Escherichia coli]EFC4899461.1 DUF4761 family protein [Escherichia coli]EFG3196680.1 DUF4761 family protein [Escherichia coli]EFJ9415467.1 DUF4761 family protein [Escherichia coli]EFP2077495.1 DUF4761 family protein [Escherichia coli]